ncbi:N-acetylmuramic acid 6-phosphate etherase [candidate division TA06 bacterium]|uniref:N-acetylmuramic acid 6-phosphate etherase n=1 Tax=candidate division TA06 bacterium TaxID=2250710 RepID=A0A523XU62_UNCT6|nr:MAG: N-acetylmuramic acid 6-phosphate etherase [candidate division TA06 bacterium]
MEKKSQKKLYDELSQLLTEERNPDSMHIDEMSVREILELMNSEDKKVASSVQKELPYIEKAVQIVVESLSRGGRVFYGGAGTSGRLGGLDAAECPPTFSSPPEMVQGIIAGGPEALIKSMEGAEDDSEAAGIELSKRGLTNKDVVVGIAASRRTPYVVGAIDHAKKIGAKTIYVSCNPRAQMNIPVDVSICPTPGPEVVTGSTRMKAATAQKMILNMISTTTMVRMGKVYENLMVDLQVKSQKLEERSKRILTVLTDASYQEASQYLDRAKGNLKAAIVMIKTGEDFSSVSDKLKKAGGNVKKAIHGE